MLHHSAVLLIRTRDVNEEHTLLPAVSSRIPRRRTYSEMRVQWNTRDAGPQPQVRWGPKSMPYSADGAGPAYPFLALAATSRYELSDMCGGAAASVGWLDAGSHHVGLMSGLKPATRYYYRVGDPVRDS